MFLGLNSVELGTIIRLHGLEGTVLVKLNSPEIGDSVENMESVFIEKDGLLIPFFIESYNYNQNGIFLNLRHIKTQNYAQRFLNCKVFIESNYLSETKNNNFNENISGYSVIDINLGHIGNVKNLNKIPGNIVIEVEFNGNSILIPYVNSIVKEINHNTKTINVSTPKGLIELYL
ncbi:MAG TPA: ribosome maturation factor RimM [Bacteroidales bacterium]|nr:ribosome maturation factor RimM [Bacteroidales bacterium]